MNYYIQGDAAKAEQIRAAFEELGYDISWPGGCANPDVINIGVERHGVKYVVAETFEYIKDIIKTHQDYQELELPVKPKFKVGDWIACDADSFTLSIKSVKDGNYYFHQGASLPIKDIDEHYHLWIIADAKDGDIIGFNDCTHNDGSYIDWVGIYKHQGNDFVNHQHLFHCVATNMNTFRIGGSWRVFTAYPATKEQRDTLFAKMKEAGYEWNANKKELRKIKPHYDIANFHAGMPVLVREYDTCHWQWVLCSHFNGVGLFFAAGKTWRQCIPFNDDTKHLLGTTDMPSEEYINW